MHPSEADNLYERLSPSERMATLLSIYQSFPGPASAHYERAVQQQEELTRQLEDNKISLDEYLERSEQVPNPMNLLHESEKTQEVRATSSEKAGTIHNLESLLFYAPISDFFRSELIDLFNTLYNTGVDHRQGHPSHRALSQYDWLLKHPDLDSAQKVNFFEVNLAPKVERVAFLKSATGQDISVMEQRSKQTFARLVESGATSIKADARKDIISEELKRRRPLETIRWAQSFQAKHGFDPRPSR